MYVCHVVESSFFFVWTIFLSEETKIKTGFFPTFLEAHDLAYEIWPKPSSNPFFLVW